MANGEILRGEVYWVSVDDSIGSEQQTGRPALVIGTRGASEMHDSYIVAYMTSRGYGSPYTPAVFVNGMKSRVICNQLRTLDRSRFTKYMDTLTNEEMSRVSGALACAIGVKAPSKTVVEELEPKNNDNEELVNLRTEVTMWKQMYKKVLDQLVEMKVEADIAERMKMVAVVEEEPEVVVEPEPVVVEEVIEEVVVEEEPPVEEKEEPKPVFTGKVNINTATSREMADLLGLYLKDAYAISGFRKKNGLFTDVEELILVDRISPAKYEAIKDRVTVGEIPVVEVEEPEVNLEEVDEEADEIVPKPEVVKVNINTASVKAMTDLGFTKQTAFHIIHNRKNKGPFRSVDDLKNVDTMDKKLLKKLRDRLEV